MPLSFVNSIAQIIVEQSQLLMHNAHTFNEQFQWPINRDIGKYLVIERDEYQDDATPWRTLTYKPLCAKDSVKLVP